MLSVPRRAGPAIENHALAHAAGLAIVAVATAVRWALDPWMGDLAPFATAYGAVALVVWVAGLGPAVVAAIVAFLAADYLFIAPRGSLADLLTAPTAVALLAYSLSCFAIIAFGEGMHRATRRQRRHGAMLALAMRAGAMGAWARDLRTGEVWWSRELEEIFGLHAGGFSGNEDGFFALVHEEDRAGVAAAVEAAIRDAREYAIDFRYRHASGEWRWMEGRGRASYSADGRPETLYGIGIDVTAQRAQQQRLRESEERLREADRRKDEFIAALSHELRNPLAPMRTALHILRMPGAPDERTRNLHAMLHRQVEQMSRLVEDLLDISRIARGTIELRMEPVDLAPELRAAVEACRAGFAADARDVRIDIPEAGLVVVADRVRLQQVMENLLVNAIKFTEPGGHIEVRARVVDDEVELRFTDDGVGIAPDDLGRIWDLFVQVHPSPERARRGLGIGLALVKDLVARFGGRVEAQSAGRGRGSSFLVRLPRAAATPVSVAGVARGDAAL